MLPILTGGTLGLFCYQGPAQSQSQLVKETTKSQLLDMSKAQMPKLDVPLHPDLLVGGEVLVRVVDDIGHGLECGLGFAFTKQGDSWEEACIISHGYQVGSIFVPFSSVMKDSEVVFQFANGLPFLVPGQESLGADE